MAPSATHHRRSPRGIRAHLRRRRNAVTPKTPTLAGAAPTATARALAAGLWRLRYAERQAVNPNPNARRHDAPAPHSPRHRRKAKLCNGNKTRCDLGVVIQCKNHSILDKIDACVAELPYGCWMEKATKWDQHVCLHNMLGSHDLFKLPHTDHARAMPVHGHATAVALEAELDKARGQISELEDEKRAMRKKVERFLRKLTDEKASWKNKMRDKAEYVMATLKEEVKTERNHRRQLEAANGKLMKEAAEAKASAKQAAQSYEMERKAWEMMEEACEELTKEVEEDQAEVELLRRECVSMREEMEEERRMLQMAEVWREERVQMKLLDAKMALEQKYSQLNRLQAEMESFLRTDGNNSTMTMREARMMSEAASSVRFRGVKELSHRNPHAPEDVDRVFQHFCRKEEAANGGGSPASNVHSVSPATDIFLEKLDGSVDMESRSRSSSWETPDRRDSCASAGTSDRSVGNGKGGSGVTDHDHHPRRSASGKNTALIRRLWRSAISESRKKTAGTTTQTPCSEQRSTVVTPTLPVEEQEQQRRQISRESKGLARGGGGGSHKQKQSLQEKLAEARMDDHKPSPCSAPKQNN